MMHPTTPFISHGPTTSFISHGYLLLIAPCTPPTPQLCSKNRPWNRTWRRSPRWKMGLTVEKRWKTPALVIGEAGRWMDVRSQICFFVYFQHVKLYMLRVHSLQCLWLYDYMISMNDNDNDRFYGRVGRDEALSVLPFRATNNLVAASFAQNKMQNSLGGSLRDPQYTRSGKCLLCQIQRCCCWLWSWWQWLSWLSDHCHDYHDYHYYHGYHYYD